MASRRDRHDRGMRGPLALPGSTIGRPTTVRRATSKSEYFIDCLQASVDQINRKAPEVLGNIEIAVEEVPTSLRAHEDRVPLASAIEHTPSRRARIVLFRRPLEHRATSRRGLRRLVHRTLVEQVAALTGRTVTDLDPSFDDDAD